MAVLIVLFAGTFATIYGVSYKELQDRNYKMLQNYIDNYQFKKLTAEVPNISLNEPKMWKNPLQPKDNRLLNAVNFYSVVFASDGSVFESDNKNSNTLDTDTLIENARYIIERNISYGVSGDLIYLVGHKSEYTIVAFMDSALIDNSTATLLRNTLIFGFITLVALYFVARWLANRIVAPMQKAWEEERRFISDVSHELKTPLAVVSTNAEVLSRSIGKNKWLENINYEIDAMNSLVNSMMDLTLSESNCSDVELVNFSKLIEKEALAFEIVAFEQGLNFTCEVASGISIKANAPEMAQLVRVLIDNAIAHSAKNSPIYVTLTQTGTSAMLKVSNEISQAQAHEIEVAGTESLFERFGRASYSRTKPATASANPTHEAKHAGLGLAIAKSIVVKYGGEISAEVNGSSPCMFSITASFRAN